MRPAGADGEGEDANLVTQGFLLTKARTAQKAFFSVQLWGGSAL